MLHPEMKYGPVSWLAAFAIVLPLPFTAQAQTNFFCVNLKSGFVSKPVPQNAVMNFGAAGNLCFPLGSGNTVPVNGRAIGEFGPVTGGGGFPSGGFPGSGGYRPDQFYCINPFTRDTQQRVWAGQVARLRDQGYGCLSYGQLPPYFRPY
jgi:hypothetical protein